MEMDSEPLTEQEFLSGIFPSESFENLSNLLSQYGLDGAIRHLSESDFVEQDSHLATLVEMFPNLKTNYIWNVYIDSEMQLDSAIQKLVEPTDHDHQGPKLILPKSKKIEPDFKFTPKMQSDIKGLCLVFPNVQQESIEHMLMESNGNADLCAAKISDILTRNDNVRARENELVGELEAMFPQMDSRHLRGLVQKCGGNIEACIQNIFDKDLSSKPANAWDVSLIETFQENKAVIHFDYHDRKEPVKSSISESARNAPTATTTTRDDVLFYRDQAAELCKQRNELFQKAAEAFKGKGLIGTSGASYYSQQARELDQEMRRLNEKAMNAQLELNQRIHNDEAVIDLHGLTVNESRSVLSTKCQDWEQKRTAKWLRIITGAGNNSTNRQGKLMESSIEFIKSIGWQIDETRSGNGWIVVRAGR